MYRKIFGITDSEWNALSFYGRFEQVVTWIVTLLVGAIITAGNLPRTPAVPPNSSSLSRLSKASYK